MTTMTTPQIDGLVQRTRAIDGAWRGLGAVGWGVAVTLGVVGLGVAIDAAFAPGPAARVGLDIALLVAWLIGLTIAITRHLAPRRTTAAWLQRIELACGLRHNRLVNAWQLARLDATAHGLSPALTDAAVAQGEALVPSVNTDRVVTARPALRGLLVMLLAGLAIAACYLAVPRVFHATLPRLLAPLADLPPYTPLRFTLSVDPARPDLGDDVTLAVEVLGPPFPPDATLVIDALSDHATDTVTLPMPRRRVIQRSAPPPTPIGATFASVLPSVDGSFRFHVATPHGRSAWQRVDVSPTPKLRLADVTVTLPAYAQRPDRTVPLPDRLPALVNSQLTLDVLANVTLDQAHLTLEPLPDNDTAPHADQRPAPTPRRLQLAVDPDTPQRATATLALDRSYRYTLQLVGPTGLTLREPRTGTLTALPDHPPDIAIDRPTRHSRVVVGYPIDIGLTADDDVGLARVMLQLRLPNGRPYPVDLYAHTPDTQANQKRSARLDRPATRFAATHTLDTAALNLAPGDVVTYHAAAVDTHPDPPQHATTDTHTVTIITLDEFNALLAEQQRRQQRQALADALAQAMAAANPLYGTREPDPKTAQPPEPSLDPNDSPNQGLTPETLRQLADALDQLAQQLDATDDRPDDLPSAQQARDAAEAARRLADQLEQGQPLDPQDIDTLAQCLAMCTGSGMGQGQGSGAGTGMGSGSGGGSGSSAGGSGGATGGSPGAQGVTLVGPGTG
ncbi:MAG: hypothetical protein AAFY08_16105, partial [Planctomycetota bacterium]